MGYSVIMLSKHQIDLNAPLLGTALCYWDSTSNTFSFGPGPMTPTFVDMAALFGFKPCGMSIDVLGDYELKNCIVRTPMKAIRTEIMLLEWYFLELGNDVLEFLEDDVPATALAISTKRLRGLHQAPRHWKDLSNSRAIIHVNMRVSCLSSKDLFFGRVHTDKKCQYGVEAYNPQFANRQFGLVQVIPELSNSSMNKGSSWRDMSMTPSEVKDVRTA
ncbi:unnamed protein product [Prunus brigantina]